MEEEKRMKLKAQKFSQPSHQAFWDDNSTDTCAPTKRGSKIMKNNKTIDLILQFSRILFMVSGGMVSALTIMCLVNRVHDLPVHPVQLMIWCFYCMFAALVTHIIASLVSDIFESRQQATLGLRKPASK